MSEHTAAAGARPVDSQLIRVAAEFLDVLAHPCQGVLLVKQADIQVRVWIIGNSLAGQEDKGVGAVVWVDGDEVVFLARVEDGVADAWRSARAPALYKPAAEELDVDRAEIKLSRSPRFGEDAQVETVFGSTFCQLGHRPHDWFVSYVPLVMWRGGCGARKRLTPVGGAAKGILIQLDRL